jgi:O-antigen ligase
MFEHDKLPQSGKPKNIPMNLNPDKARHEIESKWGATLLTGLMLIYPSIALFSHHINDTVYALMLMISLYFVLKGRTKGISEFGAFIKTNWLFCIVFAGFLIAEILNQYFVVGEFESRYFKIPMRFFAFPLLLFGFMQLTEKEFKWIRLAFPIAALIACIAFCHFTDFGAIRDNTMFKGTTIITYADLSLLLAFLVLATLPMDSLRIKSMLILKAVAAFAGIFVSVMYEARGGWIAIPVLAAILLHQYFKTYALKFSIRNAFIVATLVVAVGAVFLALPKVHERVQMANSDIEQFYSGVNRDTSIGYRFQLYRMAIDIWQENWKFGIQKRKGRLGNVPEIKEYIEQGKASDWILTTWHVHDEMLQQLLFKGIFGALSVLGLYLLPLIFYLKKIIKENSSNVYAHCGLMVVALFAIAGLTEPFFASISPVNLYVVLTALCMAGCSKFGNKASS